jgi:hypothetical protein
MSPVFPLGDGRAKRCPYFTPCLAFSRSGTVQAFISKPAIVAPDMPAKSMCPNCGHKMRGPSHLCDPMKVEREQKRLKALAKLTAK